VPATRESPEQFRKVIGVNLNDTYWMCQGIARVMSQSGTNREGLKCPGPG